MQNKQPLKCFVPLQKRILQTLRNYHNSIETTTQDELGMNRLRVNTQMFFLCMNVY